MGLGTTVFIFVSSCPFFLLPTLSRVFLLVGTPWMPGCLCFCNRNAPVVQSHTKNCLSCQGALKNVKKALSAAKTATVVSFAWVRSRSGRARGGCHAAVPASVPTQYMLRRITFARVVLKRCIRVSAAHPHGTNFGCILAENQPAEVGGKVDGGLVKTRLSQSPPCLTFQNGFA